MIIHIRIVWICSSPSYLHFVCWHQWMEGGTLIENKPVNVISEIPVQMHDTSIGRLSRDSNDPGYLCTISKVSYLYSTTSCNNLTQQPLNNCLGIILCSYHWNTNIKGTLEQDKCYNFMSQRWILFDSTAPEDQTEIGKRRKRHADSEFLSSLYCAELSLWETAHHPNHTVLWNTPLASDYLEDLDSEITILKVVESLLFLSQADMKNWAIFASALSL